MKSKQPDMRGDLFGMKWKNENRVLECKDIDIVLQIKARRERNDKL